jgi:DNA-binding transcriptional MocR family regulator
MTSWLPDLTDRSGPRYLAIADCLADDVRRGRLAEGERLPTHRDLADSLGLTVGTVSRAYAEAERRGLLHGEVGRGTFVGGMVGGWELPSPGVSDPTVVDLGLNLPLYAQDPDLGDALRTLAKRRDLHELLSYQPFAGSDRYRRAGAQWIARHGLDVDPANVIVTGGAQHAIAILLGTLCRAGDVVLTEPLTYPGLKSVARLLGLETQPVAMDDEGLLPDALDRACREGRARVLYCLPTLHNPTTATMSPARRDAIAEVARRHDLLIIEDDVHGLLADDGGGPLACRAPERTFYIASTSKVVAGGLRVAFVAAPADHVERVAATVAATLWALPPLTVELAAMWIDDGTADATCARKRAESAARQAIAREMLPAEAVRTHPRSYFLWLELPPTWQVDRFVRQARERGVVVTGSEAFTVGRAVAPAAVRVSLSAPASRDEVLAGLKVLSELLTRGPAPEPAIV